MTTRKAALYFATLTALFFAPLLWGEAFVEAGFLYKTPLWYNPNIQTKAFDEFDSIIATFPYQALLKEALSTGQFPFWDPYNLGGTPIAFNGQSGLFYPPRVLLVYLFPTWLAHGLSQAFHVFFAGFGCWLLARKFGLNPTSAVFIGTAWMFNPFLMGWMQQDSTNICAAYTPLCLLAVERCRHDWKGAAWLGLGLGLLILGGHLQLVYYAIFTIVLVGLVLLFHLGFSRVVWARLICAGLLAGLLSAPMLLPATHYLSQAQRPQLGLDLLVSIHRQFLKTMPPTLIFPEAWGNANDFAIKRIFGAGTFIQPELCLYVGAVTLVLALASASQRGVGRQLMVIAAVVLIIPSTPLYEFLRYLPGLDKVNSTRSIQIVHFLLCLASGFGLQILGQEKTRKKVSMLALGIFAVSFGGAFWACSLDPGTTLSNLEATGSLRLPPQETFLTRPEYASALYRGFTSVYSWSNPAIFLPLLSLLGTAIACYRNLAPQRFLIALLLFEVFSFAKIINPHHSHALLFPENPTIELLRQAKEERILGLGTIKPSTLKPLKLQDVGGYDSFYPKNSSQYLAYLMFGNYDSQRILPQQVFPIQRYQTPLVDLLGVKYLVAYPGQKLPDKTLVQEAPLSIYLNEARHPRAFLTGQYLVEEDNIKALELLDRGSVNPAQTAILASRPSQIPQNGGARHCDIVSYKLNEIVIKTESEHASLLVLTDAYSEGWEVNVDGQAGTVMRANVMFRATYVPAGRHTVTFHFQPKYFQAGLVLCSLGVLFLLGILLTRAQEARR